MNFDSKRSFQIFTNSNQKLFIIDLPLTSTWNSVYDRFLYCRMICSWTVSCLNASMTTTMASLTSPQGQRTLVLLLTHTNSVAFGTTFWWSSQEIFNAPVWLNSLWTCNDSVPAIQVFYVYNKITPFDQILFTELQIFANRNLFIANRKWRTKLS